MIFRQVQKFTACNAPMMSWSSQTEKKYCWELVLAAMRENHQLLSKADALDRFYPPPPQSESVLSSSKARVLDQPAKQCYSSYESANPSFCFFETSQELDVDRCLETSQVVFKIFAHQTKSHLFFLSFEKWKYVIFNLQWQEIGKMKGKSIDFW